MVIRTTCLHIILKPRDLIGCSSCACDIGLDLTNNAEDLSYITPYQMGATLIPNVTTPNRYIVIDLAFIELR